MRKGFFLAAMALVVILAAGSVDAQQQVFWTHPGERVDYAGAVDLWTGSAAQYAMEGNQSYISGPLNDLRRRQAANSGRPDPYYGSGVGVSAPYGVGDHYGYGRGYDNRSYGYDRSYQRPFSSTYGSHRHPRGNGNRRNGYSRPATQADVRGWGVGNALLTAGTFVAGEIRADRRDKRDDRRHQETMAELRERREYESETPRSAEARGYYGTAAARPSRPERFTVRNGTGADFCIKGKTLSPRAGDSVPVDDPDNLEISAPPGKTICPVEAELISEDTILVTCKKGR